MKKFKPGTFVALADNPEECVGIVLQMFQYAEDWCMVNDWINHKTKRYDNEDLVKYQKPKPPEPDPMMPMEEYIEYISRRNLVDQYLMRFHKMGPTGNGAYLYWDIDTPDGYIHRFTDSDVRRFQYPTNMVPVDLFEQHKDMLDLSGRRILIKCGDFLYGTMEAPEDPEDKNTG